MNILRRLFARGNPSRAKVAVREAVKEAINLSVPAEVAGAELYIILNPQIKLLVGKDEAVPATGTFASEKSRGAILGTALFVALGNFQKSDTKAILETVTAAFFLVYGDVVLSLALETFESAAKNDVISWASDWAFKDAERARSPGSDATPSAFYLAATQMI